MMSDKFRFVLALAAIVTGTLVVSVLIAAITVQHQSYQRQYDSWVQSCLVSGRIWLEPQSICIGETS